MTTKLTVRKPRKLKDRIGSVVTIPDESRCFGKASGRLIGIMGDFALIAMIPCGTVKAIETWSIEDEK